MSALIAPRMDQEPGKSMAKTMGPALFAKPFCRLAEMTAIGAARMMVAACVALTARRNSR